MDEDDITLCFQVPRCVSIYFSFFCYWFNVNGWFVCEGLCLVAPQYCSANRTKKKTATSLKQCYFDGKNVIEDDLCNDNGFRIKNLCREFSLCMTQSFFNHPLEERYTWYSGDKVTKKVLDYVLVEPYIQEFIQDCFVSTDCHFESDHRLIITDLCTPKTR